MNTEANYYSKCVELPLSVAYSQMIYKRDKISDEKFCLLQLYKLELPLSNDRIEVSEV